jgi:hypothetical protein
MKKQIKTEDFLQQERSNYNRQSGKKTLAFVGILIFFVVILSIVTILMV